MRPITKRRWFAITLPALLLACLSASAGEVVVVDGDTLEIAGTAYRLHGIDTPEPGQKCNRPNGKKWPCGNEATDALTVLVRGKDITCDNRGRDDYDRTLAVCKAGLIEINDTMVRRGHAWAYRKFSDDYVGAEAEARKAGLGIWRAETETAWVYRKRRWEVAKQKAPDGCPIKGNISKSGRIYHAPWSPWYSRTRVSLKKGETWFCTEREALDAGWRAPRWGRN